MRVIIPAMDFKFEPKVVSISVLSVIAVAVLLVWAGRSCNIAARISTVYVTGEAHNSVENESRLYFVPDDEPVILVVEFDKITAETTMNTHWYYVAKNTIVHESSQKINKKGRYTIRLNRNAGDSEVGDYKVEVALDGTPQTSVYFRIAGELPPPPTEKERKEFLHRIYNIEEPPDAAEVPILSQFATASSVYGLTQAPKETKDVFPRDAEVIYLTMLLTSAPEGTKVRVDWYFLGADGSSDSTLIIPAELTTWGTRQLAFNLKPGTGDLPAGKYEAAVSLNDVEFARIPFEVR